MNLSAVLDPGRTAMLVVDLQNGFCHPNGTLGRALGTEAVGAAYGGPARRPLDAYLPAPLASPTG